MLSDRFDKGLSVGPHTLNSYRRQQLRHAGDRRLDLLAIFTAGLKESFFLAGVARRGVAPLSGPGFDGCGWLKNSALPKHPLDKEYDVWILGLCER